MKIAKALKQKNKLVSGMKQLKERLDEYNSVIKGNPRPYDIGQLQTNLTTKMHELIAPKPVSPKRNLFMPKSLS